MAVKKQIRQTQMMNSHPTKNRLPQIAAVAMVIVIGAAVILLATSGPPSASTSAASGSGSSSSPGSGNAVDISNFKYAPADLTVAAGTKVTFTNSDTAAHTATSDTGGVFDTGTLQKGDSKAVTLSKPGTYTYYCRFHSFMHGTITVK